MKKIVATLLTLLCLTILWSPVEIAAVYEGNIKYSNYLLINLDTGQTLLEKNADEQVSIASLTKIMTVIVALEKYPDLGKKVTISDKMLSGLREADASLAGFWSGEKVTVEDLIYGALLPSGADATKALAIQISGSEKEYTVLMNQKAKELGMNNTVYKNSSGLDTKGQYSSAHDQMLLLKYCLNNAKFVKAFTASKYTTSDGNHKFKSTMREFLNQNENKATFIKGGKTGYEDSAGICLASYVDQQGDRLLFIGLGNKGNKTKARKYLDDINVYSYYIDNYELQAVYKAEDIIYKTTPHYTVQKEVEINFGEDVWYYLPNVYDPADVKVTFSLEQPVSYRTTIEDVIANYLVTYQDETVKSGVIRLREPLTTNLWLQGLEVAENHPIMVIGSLSFLIVAFTLILLVSLRNNKNRRRIAAKKGRKKPKTSLSHR